MLHIYIRFLPRSLDSELQPSSISLKSAAGFSSNMMHTVLRSTIRPTRLSLTCLPRNPYPPTFNPLHLSFSTKAQAQTRGQPDSGPNNRVTVQAPEPVKNQLDENRQDEPPEIVFASRSNKRPIRDLSPVERAKKRFTVEGNAVGQLRIGISWVILS